MWFPWVILFWEKTLLGPNRKTFLAFALVLTVQFLAGSPEIYLMSMGLLLLDGIRLRGDGEARPYRKTLLRFAAANALVLGITMVQVLPTIELFLESRGPSPLNFETASKWSLRPTSLINVFFPSGEIDTNRFSGVHYFFRSDYPFLVSHYMGVACLFGIALWFFYGSWKERYILLGLTIVSLIFAMGSYTPLFDYLFHYFPPIRLFRFPAKFFFLSQAFLLFMALKGFHEFLEKNPALRKRHLIVLSAIPLLFVIPYFFLRFETMSLVRLVVHTTHITDVAPTLKSSSGILFYLERQITLVFGILLLLFLWKKGYLRSTVFQPLIVALVFLDLCAANRPFRYLQDPKAFFDHKQTISTQDPAPYRIFYYPGPNDLHPSRYPYQKTMSFAEFNAANVKNLVPNTGVLRGFEYMQELDAFVRWPYMVFLSVANSLPPDRLYALLGTLNIGRIISFEPLPSGDNALIRHFPQYPSWLYQVNPHVPRAYIVPRVVVEKEPVEVVKRMSGSGFAPLQEVILGESFPIVNNGAFQADAEIVDYANQFVTIRASLNASGLLILADSFYPGWRAYVDGREENILRANLFFRAVPLTAGEHTVEFRYEPLSFTLGCLLSLLTSIGILLWYGVYNRLRIKWSN